jgi:hypothetical protein
MPRARTRSTARGSSGSRSLAAGGGSSTWARAWAAKVLRPEGLLPGEQLEGDDGERVAVGGGRAALAHRLLRRDVRGRAEHLAGLGDLVLEPEPGDAEVGQREAVALVEQHVGRLDVAVDDPLLVRRVERVGRLVQPAQRDARLDVLAGAQPVGHGAASQELHHDERAPIVLADVVDRDHVGDATESPAAVRASRWKRRARASSSPRWAPRTLTATARSSSSSCASQTLAMPPFANVPHDAVAVGQGDACGRVCHVSTVPNAGRSLCSPRHGTHLSLLRQAARLRPEPLALDGRHEAPLRREPPEGPDRSSAARRACTSAPAA